VGEPAPCCGVDHRDVRCHYCDEGFADGPGAGLLRAVDGVLWALFEFGGEEAGEGGGRRGRRRTLRMNQARTMAAAVTNVPPLKRTVRNNLRLRGMLATQNNLDRRTVSIVLCRSMDWRGEVELTGSGMVKR
jgi:hypothetical protein